MERVIHIKHTKCLEDLFFQMPKKHGVYLLVGENGAGKTSILSCLYQLGYKDALKECFNTNSENEEVDKYANSEITYIKSDEEYVTYGKRGKLEKRWKPTGTKGLAKNVLASFGFSTATFIKADHKRLSPSNDEIKKGEFISANKEIKTTLNYIFSEEKYNHLKRLKVKNGRGRNSSFFYVIEDNKREYFYSEKRFSTGELAILNLVEKISSSKENSLILLDEAELALHPKAQLNLLSYLNKIADEKNLTVFISTHSPTMIRATNRSKIILLNQTDKQGVYEVITPCFPAYAIGFVEFNEYSNPDVIICVEDDMSESILRNLLTFYLNSSDNKLHNQINYQIIPIGGYNQTITFVENAEKKLFHNQRICAVLDHDAFDNIKHNSRRIFDLGITPEIALVSALEKNQAQISSLIKQEYSIHEKIFSDFLKSDNYLNACKKENANERVKAKDKFKSFIKFVSSHSTDNESSIKNTLIRLFVPFIYDERNIQQISSQIITSLTK